VRDLCVNRYEKIEKGRARKGCSRSVDATPGTAARGVRDLCVNRYEKIEKGRARKRCSRSVDATPGTAARGVRNSNRKRENGGAMLR
jgi:hypothetical protein